MDAFKKIKYGMCYDFHEMTLNFAKDPPFPNGPIQPDPGHPNQMRADFEGWTNYYYNLTK
jgi:hypothetical protein